MGLKFGLISLFLASSVFAAPRDSSKITVSLLIGVADSDSLTYLEIQVEDVKHAIPDYVEFKYLPLGLIKSTKNNDSIDWQCPLLGEVECELDRVNTCLVKKETEQEKKLMFWSCESMGIAMWPGPDPFNLNDVETLLKGCSEMFVPDFDKIMDCRNSEESTQYLIEHEKFLNENGIKKLPAVWFNNKYDKDLDVAAQKDLLGTVCGLLEPKPSGCNK